MLSIRIIQNFDHHPEHITVMRIVGYQSFFSFLKFPFIFSILQLCYFSSRSFFSHPNCFFCVLAVIIFVTIFSASVHFFCHFSRLFPDFFFYFTAAVARDNQQQVTHNSHNRYLLSMKEV